MSLFLEVSQTLPTNAPRLRFATWNARSMKAKHKSTAICDFVIEKQLDVLAITETWLSGDDRDNFALADIKNTLPNYQLHHTPRRNGRGGGIALLIRDGLHVHQKDTREFKSMEHMIFTISSGSTSFELVIIYRPPPSKKNKLTPIVFFEELSSVLETVTVGANHMLITGDFNVHVDVEEDHDSIKLRGILDRHSLQQHVRGPTHTGNHTLDLLISRADDDLVRRMTIDSGSPSDHSILSCLVNVCRPRPSVKRIKSRSIKTINQVDFCKDIKSQLEPLSTLEDLDSLTNGYHEILSNILNKHAPVQDKEIILRPHAPWYTDSLRKAKQERRQSERRWLRTGLTVHKQSYQDQCETYRSLLNKTKTEYHSKQIAETSDRSLFRIINKLSSPTPDKSLPIHDKPKDLADSFAVYFDNKIKRLQANLQLEASTAPSSEITPDTCGSTFSNLLKFLKIMF